MAGGRGDAYRHYVTSRLLSLIMSDGTGIDASEFIVVLGGLNENYASNPQNATMDNNNNSVGARSRLANTFPKDFWENATLDFMNDVAKGKLVVIETGEARHTTPADIHREPYERPYRPNIERYKDPFNSGDTMIA